MLLVINLRIQKCVSVAVDFKCECGWICFMLVLNVCRDVELLVKIVKCE